MKKILIFLVSTVLFFSGTKIALADTSFFDDFNDGILDGYTFVNDLYWIEGGILRQNTLGLGAVAFVNGHEYTDQIIEDDTKVDGMFCFSGFMFWYQDPGNSISVAIEPTYDRIRVIEKVDGNTVDYHYPVSLNDGQWYNLRVEADSTTGEIDMYVDGIYRGTHYSVVEEKVGPTGLFTACDNLISPPLGLYIDNFSIKIPPYSNDSDGDGVLDEADLCPNTIADTWDKPIGKQRWQVMTEPSYSWYQNVPDKNNASNLMYGYDVSYTYGCSGNQVLDILSADTGEDYSGVYKFGLTDGLLNNFHFDYAPE